MSTHLYHLFVSNVTKMHTNDLNQLATPNTRWPHKLRFVMAFAVYGTFLVILTTQSHTHTLTHWWWRLHHAEHHLLIRGSNRSYTPMEEPPGAVQTLFTWGLKGRRITAPLGLALCLPPTQWQTNSSDYCLSPFSFNVRGSSERSDLLRFYCRISSIIFDFWWSEQALLSQSAS